MKLFYTLLFTSMGSCAVAQESPATILVIPAVNAVEASSQKTQRRTKRFAFYISNHLQKNYGEAVPDDVNAESGLVTNMNRLAGYAYYHENDMNEKLKHVKKLQHSCENIMRVQHFREGLMSAVAVLLQIAK